MKRTLCALALIGMMSSLASAAPIVTPLSFDVGSFGFADPGVVAQTAGFAIIEADAFGFGTFFANDPVAGDFVVVDPSAGRELKLHVFFDPAPLDFFRVSIINADTFDVITEQTFSGFFNDTITFDLDPLALPPLPPSGYALEMEFASVFGPTAGGTATVSNLRWVDPDATVIPEPGTWALFGLAAALLAWRRRR